MPDHYHTLGVSETAAPEEIRRAYNAIAKAHHPDLNPGNAASLEKFVAATEAYAVLSDSTRRAAYDAEQKRPRQKNSDALAAAYDPAEAPVFDRPPEPPASAAPYYGNLGEPPADEPPYGMIAAVLAVLGILGMMLAALGFA